MHKYDKIVDYIRWYTLLFNVLLNVFCVAFKHDEGMLDVDVLDDLLGLAVVVSKEQELIVFGLLFFLYIAMRDEKQLFIFDIFPDN